MAHLIDKDALVAEIEKRIKQFVKENNTLLKNSDNAKELRSRIIMCKEVLSFIDTFEVKDVDLNLEITLWANTIPEIRLNDVERLAKYFFELGLKVQKGE